MGRQAIRTVAVLGGGPSGAALAALLARRGVRVAVFSRGRRPPVVVGESLVPAIVPFLRELGIEQEVASYSVWKGGATFVYDGESRLSFRFHEVRGAKTTYSYNVPRDRFDASVLDAAKRAGAAIVEHGARLVRDGGSDRLALDEETLAAARSAGALDGQPDLIVDAGGRARLIPNLLGIPSDTGPRRDTALHAHLSGVEVEIEGNVHTDRLEHGWCWRIPLPGRVSVGFIVDGEYLRTFGDTNEEQYDNYLRRDRVIRDWAKPATRITPVVRYSNYQLLSRRGVGENWALVGDAFGFVDPVFSSGLLIAFESAAALADAVLDGSDEAFARYEKLVQHKLASWQRVVSYFYDGRLLTLFRVGEFVQKKFWGKLLNFHFRKHMPRIFTGEDATNPYSLWLVSFMVTHGLYQRDPRELQIN
jgi:flavin-dependent dehydrogenase